MLVRSGERSGACRPGFLCNAPSERTARSYWPFLPTATPGGAAATETPKHQSTRPRIFRLSARLQRLACGHVRPARARGLHHPLGEFRRGGARQLPDVPRRTLRSAGRAPAQSHLARPEQESLCLRPRHHPNQPGRLIGHQLYRLLQGPPFRAGNQTRRHGRGDRRHRRAQVRPRPPRVRRLRQGPRTRLPPGPRLHHLAARQPRPPAVSHRLRCRPFHRSLRRVHLHRRALRAVPRSEKPPHPAHRPAPPGNPRAPAPRLHRPPRARPGQTRRRGHPRHRLPPRPARQVP